MGVYKFSGKALGENRLWCARDTVSIYVVTEKHIVILFEGQ